MESTFWRSRASGAWTREQRVAYHVENLSRILAPHGIVINLQQVNYVDSAGREHSSKCRQKTKAKSGSLKLCNLRPNEASVGNGPAAADIRNVSHRKPRRCKFSDEGWSRVLIPKNGIEWRVAAP